MAGKLFSLHKRGKYYYCEFKGSNGKFSIVKSTHCTRYVDAENWSIENSAKYSTIKSPSTTFNNFTKDFFSEKGLWYITRISEGRSTPVKILHYYEKAMQKHLLPTFGEMALKDITKSVIRTFKADLIQKKYSGATINLILVVLRYILKEAEDEELILTCPPIKSVTNHPKQKGVLTKDDVVQLFSSEWEQDLRSYTANLIAAQTGMRMAEVSALTPAEIDFDRKLILVKRSYNHQFQTLNHTTKNGKQRICPVSDFVLEKIKALIAQNPHDEVNYIFYTFQKDRPISPSIITDDLRKQLSAMGIDWKTRAISFHSWRSYFNSLLINSNIPMPLVQAMIGHSSNAMSNLYYRIGDTDYTAIRELQEGQITLQ